MSAACSGSRLESHLIAGRLRCLKKSASVLLIRPRPYYEKQNFVTELSSPEAPHASDFLIAKQANGQA